MNNPKSKGKKRKLSDLEESSSDDSSVKGDDLGSDKEEGGSKSEDDDENSLSDSSHYSFESQSESDASIKKFRMKSRTNFFSSDSSESGDESCEKCAICLRYITNQEVGNPEGCDHLFCSFCLIEWSKNSNVCPLDRQQFSIILVRENKNGEIAKKVPVEESQAVREDNIVFEHYDTVCEVCGSGDREDILLLCDLCNRGFHTVCLTPPLESVPDENEWYCPYCDRREIHAEVMLPGFFDVPSTSGSLRPRVQMVRTRLLERIRVTVNMIMENYVPHNSDLESADNESLCSFYTVDFDSERSDAQPGSSETSGTGATARNLHTAKRVRKSAKSRKRSSVSTKKTTARKRKSTTRKRKKPTKGKGKTKRRKTRATRTTRTKKVKVENEDGTITEKIVKTRTYKKRRKQKRKKQSFKAPGARRGLRVKSITTPKTVKGRLALTLGMVPPKKPGQLLPDIKVKPPHSHMSAIDINRARAGIPKLHIFGPRDELQYYSSESENEELIGGGSGGVATVIPQRSSVSRFLDRKKATLALQSMPPSTVSKPKPVIEPPTSEYVDILGSIMDSQAVWHSKNTNVKINEDGSIEVIKDKDKNNTIHAANTGIENKQQNNKAIDVREGKLEGLTTQAPMHPGAGSRSGEFRPNNRHTYGENRSGGQDNTFSPRSAQSSSSVNFNRFGAPARNDREGYTNYLNNMPRGPTPFCRGGPPLRFRMPPRQQLRRITIPVRNRPAWQRDDDDDENDKDKDKEKSEKDKKEEEGNEQSQSSKQEEEEDIDLYSDIETSVEKADNSGGEDSAPSYPALGPPPEPPAFLLCLEENGEFDVESKKKSEVYDPAEPCDSEDEMVIDENKEQSPLPEKKESEEQLEASSKTKLSHKPNSEKESSDDDDNDEDCPIFSIYSSATREFSQKEEEERQKEIAEERRKIEELKLQEEQKSERVTGEPKTPVAEKPKIDEQIQGEADQEESDQSESKKKDGVQSRLPFAFKSKLEEKESQVGSSPSPKSARESSRSRSKSVTDDKGLERRSSSSEIEKDKESKSSANRENKSSSPEQKYKRPKRKSKGYDSDSEEETRKGHRKSDDDKENKGTEIQSKTMSKEEKFEKDEESETETVSQKVATGLEGLDVEEVSSDNEDDAEFENQRSLSSLSLSELSNTSKTSRSPIQMKKKSKKKKKKIGKSKSGKNYEEGEIDDSEKDNRLDESFERAKTGNEEIGNENALKTGEKKRQRSASSGSERQILGSKENKKITKGKSKDKDLSWKKPSKKEKNYREGKKRSKERARSRSGDRRKSKSPSPKKDKKKNKDRKKKTEKKKELERYDVRKIVKNKEIRKTDAFGRDILSKSRSISRSRSRTPIRGRSRNMLRRESRSYSRSRSRSFRRGRSPIRRRYLRSRTRSRSKSVRSVRSYSRSRSRSRSRKSKKKLKSKDRVKLRSRSRGRKSRSISRSRRRSLTRSRSRSPIPRVRSKKSGRPRRSWSHHLSRSPSFSPRRSRSITRSPIRVRRSYTRSVSSRSWSRGRSPLPRTSSLEKLTVVLTTKDKKKKKKEGKKSRKEEKKRKKTGNCKEVFASGDNVLVSVNFRNNNSTGNNISSDGRNTRINSLSPVLETESSRKKKKGSDYENERVTKKSKKSNPISKKVVDVALSNTGPKRAKKLTRLSEKDAEVILNRKPVAVIDLDMSPYREQTPSPVNVVVVSDSGSGDEGKEHTPQRANARATPGIEVEVIQENVVSQSVNVSAPSSPLENGYVPTYGPKTPPEPQIKFSINKPQQLRQIANPLGDDDDDDEVEEEEGDQRVESLDRRIEKELGSRNEVSHKGPNTPPTPRGPTTPKTPPSPQTSPDAYDPFEPTKSRSPSPSQADKENHPSPKTEGKDDQPSGGVQTDGLNAAVTNSLSDSPDKINDVILENHEDKPETLEKGEATAQADCSSNVISSQATTAMVSDVAVSESPERKIGVIITTPQNKNQPQAITKPYVPVLKQLPMVVSSASTATPTSTNLTVSSDVFSMPSPTKTSRSGATSTTQALPMTGIQRLQHRLGSPVNRTPSSVKSTPEKRSTPRTEPNETMSSGNYMIRNASKRNGEQPKQPRPLQDATNETVDMTMDLDDSPYSPASSEGDDLFDPPVEPPKPSQSNSKPAPSYKAGSKTTYKSPVKQLSKFDLLFGPCGPTLSPVRVGSKKTNPKVPPKASAVPKVLPQKPPKKPATITKKNVMHKMDEDQLRILDELPSSAVELQVKDKFLKKLNRQERVVDEVKTVLKPHYARKHITKEEYKDILRRSVPKICHSRSGEINPSKIQSLIEAYVKKFRHAKKKGINAVSKPKTKKTMFS